MELNIYRAYLALMLHVGNACIKHAYKMTDRWGANVGPKKTDAAWETSQQLILHHHYHQCLSCGWAVTDKNEHLKLGSGNWCYDEAFQRRYGLYPDDEIDGVPAHMVKPQLLLQSVTT